MKVSLKSAAIICLVIVLAYAASAQKKKSATGPSAEDKQRLGDAYDVINSLVSSGTARDDVFAKDNGERVQAYTYRQSNLSADQEGCVIRFDFHDPEAGSDNSEVVLLPWIDLRSLKVVPFGNTGMDKVWATHEDFKVSDEGFVLRWSYLKAGYVGGAAVKAKDGPILTIADQLFLSTQEDADRTLKALAYAAKSCGAHETAF